MKRRAERQEQAACRAYAKPAHHSAPGRSFDLLCYGKVRPETEAYDAD